MSAQPHRGDPPDRRREAGSCAHPRRYRCAPGLALFAVLTALIGSLAAHAEPRGYLVIVNPHNPIQEIDRSFLSAVFLKRITRWPSGAYLYPVDRTFDSPVRQAFTEDVFDRPVNAIRNTWLQAIFDGSGVPPPELDSDAEVVAYVLSHPGAIGYVAPDAKLDGARVVRVR